MLRRVSQLFTSSPSGPGGDAPMFSSQFSVGQPLDSPSRGEADHYPPPTSPAPKLQRKGTETSYMDEAVSPELAGALERIETLEDMMKSTLETVERQQGVIADLQQRLIPLEAARRAPAGPGALGTEVLQEIEEVPVKAPEGRPRAKRGAKGGVGEAEPSSASAAVEAGYVRLGSVLARTGGPTPAPARSGSTTASKSVVVDKKVSTAGPSSHSTSSHSYPHSSKADPYITNDPLFGSLPIKYHRAYQFYYCTLCDAPVSNISKHFQTIQRNKPVHRAKVHACTELLPAALATYPESNPHDCLPFPPTSDNPHPHFIPDIFAEPGYACRLCTYCTPTFPTIRSHCVSHHDVEIDDEEEDPDAHPYTVMPQLQKFFTLGSWFPSTVPNPSTIPSRGRSGDTKPALFASTRPRVSTSKVARGPGENAPKHVTRGKAAEEGIRVIVPPLPDSDQAKRGSTKRRRLSEGEEGAGAFAGPRGGVRGTGVGEGPSQAGRKVKIEGR